MSFILFLLCSCITLCIPCAEAQDVIHDERAENFRLLYSTTGYDSRATKRVLIRALNEVDPETISSGTWRLFDDSKNTIATGDINYLGISYGMQLWECDFSNVNKEGTFTLEVSLIDNDGKFFFKESTLPFMLESDFFSKEFIFHLTIENGESREAPEEYGGGYFDCNSEMGEAHSHGVFLNALAQTYKYYSSTLSNADKDRLINQANRAFDYLLRIQDKKTGQIKHEDASRPYGGSIDGIWCTQEGVYGLAAYLDIFKDVAGTRANNDTYELIKKSVDYLDHKSDKGTYAYYENMIPVYFHMYQYSGDEIWKQKAVYVLNSMLRKFNLQAVYKNGNTAIPYFEGLYLMATAFPEDPNHDYWIERARDIKDRYYYYLIDNNGLHILPLQYQWTNMKAMLSPEDAQYKACWHVFRAASAMDAIFLAELTGDNELEKIAAGEIGYIMGINMGFKKEFVLNPASDKDYESASFIVNAKGRYVKPWTEQTFEKKNNTWMSIASGYSILYDRYTYSNVWWNGELYIKNDGAYAYAMCVYEDFINRLL